MPPAAHERALEIREGLRALGRANNDEPLDIGRLEGLNRAAAAMPMHVSLEPADWALQPAAAGVDGFLGQVIGTVAAAVADGSWSRVKACRNDTCRWLFYDHSRNRSEHLVRHGHLRQPDEGARLPRPAARGCQRVSGIEVLPLTAERWPDLERLFGPSGAYSNCWCTFQRQTGREFGAGCENRGAGNRALLRALTAGGSPPGLIGYRDGSPVGWVSVGPRTEFGRILRSPITRLAAAEAADATRPGPSSASGCRAASAAGGWGAPCSARRSTHARSAGAERLEAYPVDTHGTRIPNSDAFTGTLDLFAGEGFERIAERVTGRPVVSLHLSGARA